VDGTEYDPYEPTAPTAPSPQRAPSPPIAPIPALAPSPARYTYLLGRLRGRQITMEEATELFAIQQQIIIRVQAQVLPPPPPPTSPQGGSPRAAPSGAAPRGAAPTGDDRLWEALPALAAAVGIFAAVLKRAQEGGPSSPPSPRRSSGPP
jgi:hypothetical protein